MVAPPAFKPSTMSKKGVPPQGIKAGNGLVQNKDAGICSQDARNGNAPLLPAGKAQGRLIPHLVIVQAHGLKGAAHGLPRLLRAIAQALQSKAYVLFHRPLKKLIFRVLKYQSHPAAELYPVIAFLVYIFSVQQHPAG